MFRGGGRMNGYWKNWGRKASWMEGFIYIYTHTLFVFFALSSVHFSTQNVCWTRNFVSYFSSFSICYPSKLHSYFHLCTFFMLEEPKIEQKRFYCIITIIVSSFSRLSYVCSRSPSLAWGYNRLSQLSKKVKVNLCCRYRPDSQPVNLDLDLIT